MDRVLDLDKLTPSQKDEWAHLLRAEAARDRRTLTTAQALEAWFAAPLTEGWEQSKLADVGRVRIAARRLVLVDRWRPDQIRDAMLTLALHVCPERGIAELVVEEGINDALELLGDTVMPAASEHSAA